MLLQSRLEENSHTISHYRSSVMSPSDLRYD